ncbi:hypothetical protein BS47DRAFT_1364955 [Hydnum rufescens UP504]|uniref:Uncharacterized protein n=1 Tax=Hydnum rufescens UP504 TaxID=1448309 RepID=A0A9P6APV2_9AGAM|nr:hypothetical protein BS47DRAFT_1364955 [Hydnum rufescens UP504]
MHNKNTEDGRKEPYHAHRTDRNDGHPPRHAWLVGERINGLVAAWCGGCNDDLGKRPLFLIEARSVYVSGRWKMKVLEPRIRDDFKSVVLESSPEGTLLAVVLGDESHGTAGDSRTGTSVATEFAGVRPDSRDPSAKPQEQYFCMDAPVFDIGSVGIDSQARAIKKNKRKRHTEQASASVADGGLDDDGSKKKGKKKKNVLPDAGATNSRDVEQLGNVLEAGAFRPGDSPTAISKKKKKKKDKKDDEGNVQKIAADSALPSSTPPASTLASASAPLDFSTYETADDLLRAIKRIPRAKVTQSIGGGPQQKESSSIIPPKVARKPHKKIRPETSTSLAVQEPPVSSSVQPPPSRPPSQLPPPSSRDAGEKSGDHAVLLSSRWLHSKQLQDLAESEGLVYKKGKFSATEDAQVHAAITQYAATNDINMENDLNDIIFAKNARNDSKFWTEITQAVPLRPVTAVYHYVRRKYNPLSKQGKWSDEEDRLLKRSDTASLRDVDLAYPNSPCSAVIELGLQWEAVSLRVGRTSSDCRDRYRNYVEHDKARSTGPWTKEEEDQLYKIVRSMTIDIGRNPDREIYWSVVCAKMGHKRSRQQCRIKWTDGLSKRMKASGDPPRWGAMETYNLGTPQITKILLAKYATLPPTKQSRSGNVGKTIKSKEIIEDSNDEERGDT